MNSIIEDNVWKRINLSQKDIQQEKSNKIGSAKISFFASPSDVPNQMRTIQNNEDIIIEFKYLTSEESTKKVDKNDVTLEVGKSSGKIYKVIISKSSIEEDTPLKLEIAFETAESSVENLQNSSGGFRAGNIMAIANSLKSLLDRGSKGYATA